jgi:hypothetical protein
MKLVLRVRLHLASTLVLSGQAICLVLFVIVGNKSASALTFGLVSSGILWWARPLTDRLTAQRYRNLLETIYRRCRKMGDTVLSVRQSFSTLWGTCRVVAEGDISCYSYGVTIVWSLDILRHLTVTCKTTVFENTAFYFILFCCMFGPNEQSSGCMRKRKYYIQIT